MTAKTATDRQLAIKLIQEFEKHECLYDKDHDDYRNESIKSTAYKSIVSEVNSKLRLRKPLTENDAKNKWRNFRKAYRNSIKNNTKYYLAEYIQFLTPHLAVNSGTNDNEDDAKSADGEGNDDGNSTAQENSEKTQATPKVNSALGANNETNTENEVKTPPPSEKYKRNRDKIAQMEESTMKIAEEAMDVMKNLMESDDNEKYDIHLAAIRQALSKIPPCYFLECINGTLAIIDTFLEDLQK